jgi:DNA repair exonuclease SbcCD ATPase subunit
LKIKADPRGKSSMADLVAQFNFLLEIRDKLTETHDAISSIRESRKQINEVVSRIKDETDKKAVQEMAKALDEKMTLIEKTLYQTQNRSGQDPLNFPIRLNNKLSNLVGTVSSGDFPPTEQAIAVKQEISAQIDEQLSKWRALVATDLPAFNTLVKSKNIPAVVITEKPAVP